MNVMIFAAGLGTRLQPFTNHHPKALAPVSGIPALGHNLQKIREITEASIGQVVINIHHFPDQIRQYIASSDINLPIVFSDESSELLDTGGGLMKAAVQLTENLADDTLLLINADILTDLPFNEIIKAHRASDADATLLCANRESSRTLWFNSDNRLVGWENIKTGETKPAGFATDKETMTQSPFCGVHVLKASTVIPELMRFGGQIHPFSIIPFYLSSLNSLKVSRFLLPTNNHWFDIGSPEKLAAASDFFANK